MTFLLITSTEFQQSSNTESSNSRSSNKNKFKRTSKFFFPKQIQYNTNLAFISEKNKDKKKIKDVNKMMTLKKKEYYPCQFRVLKQWFRIEKHVKSCLISKAKINNIFQKNIIVLE